MEDHLNEILDECIDRINRGEAIDSCLVDYPDYAEQLRHLLNAVATVTKAYSFIPSLDTKIASRERFDAAIEDLERSREERKPMFGWLQGWLKVWATAAAVLLIAVISYFGIRLVSSPGETVPQVGPSPVVTSLEPGPSPQAPSIEPGPLPVAPDTTQPEPAPVMVVAQPNPNGNFVFLISDDVNAIGDFESVNLSISKISLLGSGESNQLIEFEPELGEVDLTLVQGDKTQEIWRGTITEGEYTSISIHVIGVHGILKETGEEVEIKLPSQKLHISKHFQVSSDMLTTFTYDLTVVAAGSPENRIKYILKPQIDQSGADHKPFESKGKTDKEKPDNKKPGIKKDS
jgi:hypothetical protein